MSLTSPPRNLDMVMECRTNIPHVKKTTKNTTVLKIWNTLEELGKDTNEDNDIFDDTLLASVPLRKVDDSSLALMLKKLSFSRDSSSSVKTDA
mmetsp:Transcript_30367/g.46348  ORF Transcript_30367/g.46348 Transcript_30367/m.46348 type:complete len:93 (+) Transcript_30367:244-522(+)